MAQQRAPLLVVGLGRQATNVGSIALATLRVATRVEAAAIAHRLGLE
jgi:hypothetical protein